jgi:hypothetical protein
VVALTAPLTVAAYADVFDTWRTLARLEDGEAATLVAAIAHLRGSFDATPRDPQAFCDAFDAFLASRDGYERGGLRLRIVKSCLLDRLVYCREPPRTVKCPQHDGRWSGLQIELCPHGCNLASCGCTTGWLPARATLLEGEATLAAAIAGTKKKRQAEIWQEQLEAIRAALRRTAGLP